MSENQDFLTSLREAGEQSAYDPNKVLLMILEDASDEFPWYYDLIEDRIYASDGLKGIYGQLPGAKPMSYEEFINKMAILSDQQNIERMRLRCINEKKGVEFILHAMKQDTGQEFRVLIKAKPLLDKKGNVIALYGTDRLIEIL